MLNEDKISLMTEMAIYEKRKGKRDLDIFSYFKSDYISWQVIKSIVCATLSFCIIVGLKLFYGLEDVMVGIYSKDLAGYGKSILFKYLLFVLVYVVISFVIGQIRYKKAKKNVHAYSRDLKELAEMYREE